MRLCVCVLKCVCICMLMHEFVFVCMCMCMCINSTGEPTFFVSLCNIFTKAKGIAKA